MRPKFQSTLGRPGGSLPSGCGPPSCGLEISYEPVSDLASRCFSLKTAAFVLSGVECGPDIPGSEPDASTTGKSSAGETSQPPDSPEPKTKTPSSPPTHERNLKDNGLNQPDPDKAPEEKAPDSPGKAGPTPVIAPRPQRRAKRPAYE